MKNTLLFIILVVTMASCQTTNFEKLQDGIVIHLKQKTPEETRLVRLKVITGKIVQVLATPAETFSDEKSLMAVDKNRETVNWQVSENDGLVTLTTSELTVSVSLSTGEVAFNDKNGQPILKENQGGGKTFKPIEVEGQKFYSLRQVFESPAGEAFYGLGQHQNNQMNYKGQDVDLAQHNIVAVVPFLVSNKNYGILWDNYSRSKFGDPRDYLPLDSMTCYTEEGKAGGLTSRYCLLSKPENPVVERVESGINYEFLNSLKNLPNSSPLSEMKVTWTGSIESGFSGLHKFLLHSAGYTKLWLGDVLMVDNWRQTWNPWSTESNFEMEKGKKYPIRVEWIPDGNESYISLKWLSPVENSEQEKCSLFSEVGDQINYYFIKGNDIDEVISGYREVTGAAPVMPKWAMGLWQSRERYRTQDELLSVVKEFRKRNIPLDNIVLDWFYWEQDKWGDHEFDKSRFPDAAAMVNELHQQLNARIMISVWPKFYVGTENYKYMNEKGWLYKKNIQDNQKDWVGYVSTFYDAYNADARTYFWDQMDKKLFTKGIDAWWLDASEPDILSNSSIDERKQLMTPTALGPAAKYFNPFSLVNSAAVYDGQRKTNPDQRVFILTRSAYAGQQRYSAATWSGDVAARWYDLKAQIPAGINFSMSGIPYWTSDIGGFSVERRYENAKGEDLAEWQELVTRWYQFGAFCPLFRVHGQFPYREIFNVSPENQTPYQTMLYYDKLRYRLMPYIYSLSGKVFHENYTIMRGLMMDFPDDKSALSIGDQYLFGPSLMVCPVYQYKATSREVYLPSGAGWYELYSGKYFSGGRTLSASAPLDKVPVFVKEGSILPTGPEIQYATQGPVDPVTLFVYTGKDAQFTIYEDENVNYNYEKGAFSNIPITYKEDTKILTIGERKGTFTGMQEQRTFHIVWISRDKPVELNFDIKPEEVISYSGKEVSISFK